jgi:hypothetical protein
VPKLLSTLGPWFGACGALALIAAGWSIVAGVRGQALRCARLAYVAATGSAVVFWAALLRGRHPRLELVGWSPISDLRVTLLSVGFVWLILGVLVFALGRGRWTLARAAYWLSLTLLMCMYLNVLREREVFGDVYDYVSAAEQIARGEKLHARYLYPPLLATLLATIVQYGHHVVFILLQSLNVLSLWLLFVLLRRVLLRYGFAELSATLVSFAALCANAAVLRTLFYVQTNLHMTNLMLLSLLCYPAQPFVSALALALAVHIKTSPLVLALPFALNRDLRWLLYFGLGVFGVVAATSYANGFVHYHEYLDNVANIYRANGITFRENSIDSLVRSTLHVFKLDLALATRPVQVAKLLLFGFALWLCQRMITRRIFSGAHEQVLAKPLAATGPLRALARALGPGPAPIRAARVLDTYPVLLLLLTTLSPLIWEHHPVLIIMPFLVMLKKLDREGDALLWLAAWFLCFLVPTFDVYPYSFRILLGIALAFWLLGRLARRDFRDGRLFARANAALERLSPRSAPAHSDKSSAPPVSSR